MRSGTATLMVTLLLMGRTVQINKYPFTIIGVAKRPDFRAAPNFFRARLCRPLSLNSQQISDWFSLEGQPSI